MIYKKSIIIFLSLIIVFTAVSAVSAAELNDTSIDEPVGLSDKDSGILSVSDNEKLSGGQAQVKDENMSLKISSTGDFYGETKLHVSLISSKDNRGIADENVWIFVNNNFWDSFTTGSDGKIDIDFKRMPGTYFIKAQLEDYDLETPNFSFGINGISTNFELKQTSAYYKDTQLVFKLTNMNTKKGLANEQIDVRFSNGKTATLKTNSKGIATYDVPFNPGTYSVTAKTHSKYIYSNSVTLKNFIIGKTYLAFTPVKLSTSYGSGKCFTVKVKNMYTKHPMKGVKLKLKVYTGKSYKAYSVTTDSKGVARFDVSTLSIGTHKVTINNANKNMGGFEKTSSITLTKAKLSITAPKITSNHTGTSTFKITIKNKQTKKAMSNVKATIKVWSGKNYKTITVKTNKNGQASISTEGLDIASHNVDITVPQTSKISKATAKSTILII
ncbi:hypothetical protein [uncultured Methanobrevibacter sp.]|uniref:hypothetical protein n=1 Tax=uncultured Methanobrevibacter sp. TaxID=253161 RepID=UPI0025D8C4F3|nr:hypothetical protein [uncultured Methanobrevibacter sp.]